MMSHMVQWTRSLFFIVQMYLMMAIMALFYTPMAVIHRDWAFRGAHAYCRWVRWSASWMVGLTSEIRGTVPDGEVLVASKHQSFFDIIMIVSVLPRPKFIMKKEILWTPIVGYFARRIGCIAVDRGKRSIAIKKMVADVRSGIQIPGQLIIFPQGTRIAAGKKAPYKIGIGVLYTETGQTCVPAATNVGVFWKRHGIMRYPGNAVVEFLPPILPGLEIAEFMALVETEIEATSIKLNIEAGYFTGEA